MNRPAELTFRHWLLLAVVALAMYLPGFATLPPFDRDESRYAQASHQMLETGDFVDIRFQEEPRHKKPVGIYWMQAAAVSALTGGDTHGPIWMYRLPSLLGAIAAVLLTAWTGARLFGAAAGLGAGLGLAAVLVLGVEARMAKTDAMLLATIAAAQGCLARIYMDRDKPLPPSLWLILGFWASVGLSILVKGPIVLMVTGLTILALGLWDRDARWLKRLRPGIGIPVLLAVVLPWLVAIGLRTGGAFFSYAIGHEFLGKANTGQEGHAGPPGFYLATFWLSFWPLALLGALALPWIWKRRREPAVRFCVAWIVPTWLVFEAVVTKLPHYTLPVFPAIAMLAAAATLERHDGPRLSRRWGFWLASAVWLVVGVAFAGAALWVPVQLDGAPNAASTAAAAVILATTLAIPLFELRRQTGRLLTAVLAGGFLTYATVHGALLPNLTQAWLSPQVAETVFRLRPCPGTVLAAAGYTEPSMVLLVGTNTRLGGGDTVAEHLAANPACALGLVTDRELPKFQETAAARGLAVRQVASLRGFNYSRGRWEDLGFYVAEIAPGS